MKVEEIEIKKITGNPYQTRIIIEEEPLKILAKSIRERGLFNPITILEKNKKEYIVVHGHRRLEAYKKLKRKTIPAFVKPKSKESSLITDLIHENLVREDLSVQEKALSIKLLFSQIKNIKDDLDQIISCISGGKLYNQRGNRDEKRARKKTKWNDNDMFMAMKLLKTIGMSENNAISYLTILKLPRQIQERVRFNVHNDQGESSSTRISIRMACSLARVDDEKYRDYLLKRALEGASARHIDALVNNYKIKVLKGEWKGFVRRFNNAKIIKDLDESLFLELSDKCNHLARRINSFKATKLSALGETMEKEVFFAAATGLRKEMRNLENQLREILKDKGYVNIEKVKFNEIFEMRIRESKGKKNVRGTIPRKMLRRIGLGDTNLKAGEFVQMKIVGIRKGLNIHL